MVYQNEDVYDGEWKNNKKDGKGTSLINHRNIYI